MLADSEDWAGCIALTYGTALHVIEVSSVIIFKNCNRLSRHLISDVQKWRKEIKFSDT